MLQKRYGKTSFEELPWTLFRGRGIRGIVPRRVESLRPMFPLLINFHAATIKSY